MFPFLFLIPFPFLFGDGDKGEADETVWASLPAPRPLVDLV